MFPLPSERLVLDDLSIFEQDKFLEDLLEDSAALEGDELIAHKSVEKGQRKASSAGGIDQRNQDEAKSSNDSKKIMHRDIEKERRQKMSGLCASLQSLLPPEYIKGRRSVSDHLHQAANYIKHMQKKIDEAQIKRDELKKLCNVRSAEVPNSNISWVKANISRDGMEILISSSRKNFSLSKVLADLLGRGLNVISCTSARVDERPIHKIHIEVNEYLTSTDISELEQRLVNVTELV